MFSPRVLVQEADFSVEACLDALRKHPSGAMNLQVGAVACFVGTVRERNNGDAVSSLTLEHYPGITSRSIEAIIAKAEERWPILAAQVIHRVGTLLPADQIVFVGVCSAHREAALEACAYIMDFLKTDAPFWKREETPTGPRWVDARESDEQAKHRWGTLEGSAGGT
ncbi:MAG: molybdopterin synthase catalytic subunit MoaE [Burkholderiaceae bacterium]